MTINHFTSRGIDGRWHAVYRVPGCGSLHSIGDALSESGAKRMADAANREQQRKVNTTPEDPYERRLASGFYLKTEDV